MNEHFNPGLLIDRDPGEDHPLFGDAAPVPVPVWLDFRPELLECSDQGFQPWCAAYAMAGLVEHYNWQMRGIKEQVDPTPIYKLAKTLDGNPDKDGTTLEAVAQAAAKLELLPIDLASLQTVRSNEVKRVMHQRGPLLSGFYITEGWQHSKPDGWILGGGARLGGHAVVLCGYDDEEQWYAVQNSWGTRLFGWRGFCRMNPDQFTGEFMYGLTWNYK